MGLYYVVTFSKFTMYMFYVFPVQVCKRMDMICQRVLNQGFLKVERYHSLCQRQVKAQLPRSVTIPAQIMQTDSVE